MGLVHVLIGQAGRVHFVLHTVSILSLMLEQVLTLGLTGAGRGFLRNGATVLVHDIASLGDIAVARGQLVAKRTAGSDSQLLDDIHSLSLTS